MCEGPQEWTEFERIAHRELWRIRDAGIRGPVIERELHGIVLAAMERTMPRHGHPPMELQKFTLGQIERTIAIALEA